MGGPTSLKEVRPVPSLEYSFPASSDSLVRTKAEELVFHRGYIFPQGHYPSSARQKQQGTSLLARKSVSLVWPNLENFCGWWCSVQAPGTKIWWSLALWTCLGYFSETVIHDYTTHKHKVSCNALRRDPPPRPQVSPSFFSKCFFLLYEFWKISSFSADRVVEFSPRDWVASHKISKKTGGTKRPSWKNMSIPWPLQDQFE